MLQFRKVVDTTAAAFHILNWKPNIRPSHAGLLGEPIVRGKNNQAMVDRGFFYVFANKIGTVTDELGRPCAEGNYFPVWEEDARYTYPVQAKWVD